MLNTATMYQKKLAELLQRYVSKEIGEIEPMLVQARN